MEDVEVVPLSSVLLVGGDPVGPNISEATCFKRLSSSSLMDIVVEGGDESLRMGVPGGSKVDVEETYVKVKACSRTWEHSSTAPARIRQLLAIKAASTQRCVGG